MKRKNKIILFIIIIALIIILVLIEVFRVRKKNIETFGGEYQESKACPNCDWIFVSEGNYDDSDHWDYCLHCGTVFNKEPHSKYTQSVTYPSRDLESGYCYGTIEKCSGCNWHKPIEQTKHEWKDGGYVDPNTEKWVETGDGWYTEGTPTCTEGATARRECRNCTYNETRSIPALGHNYTKYEDIGDGKNHKATCSRCGYVATEAHTLKDVNETQTCVTPEATGKQCTKCNYKTFSETKKATGHKYGIGTHSY